MKDDQHAFWESYFRRLADGLGLRDWDIRISQDASAPDDCGATITVWEHQRRATVYLNRDIFRSVRVEDRIEQRRIALHELLHCHFDELDDVLKTGFADESESEQIKTVKAFYAAGSEKLLDIIASAIAPAFDTPERAS